MEIIKEVNSSHMYLLNKDGS